MRKINEKCLACSRVIHNKRHPFPDCFKGKSCHKKICYYRRIKHYRKELVKRHRYLRFKGDKCCLCGSGDRLEVHHIVPQCKQALDCKINLITLCYQCHKTITSYHKAIGYI
jgi:hypothetical protein